MSSVNASWLVAYAGTGNVSLDAPMVPTAGAWAWSSGSTCGAETWTLRTRRCCPGRASKGNSAVRRRTGSLAHNPAHDSTTPRRESSTCRSANQPAAPLCACGAARSFGRYLTERELRCPMTPKWSASSSFPLPRVGGAGFGSASVRLKGPVPTESRRSRSGTTGHTPQAVVRLDEAGGLTCSFRPPPRRRILPVGYNITMGPKSVAKSPWAHRIEVTGS